MSAERPTVSIIIVTMNSAAFVGKALDSIKALTYAADRVRTVVVDHASKDNTVALIRDGYAWVSLIAETVNHGFAGGNNVGMKRYPADYFALVNPDVVLDPNWLTHIIDVMDADANIGVGGSKIFYDGGQLLQHAGAMFHDNVLTYHLGDHEPDNGQYDVQRDVDYVMGAAMVSRGALTRELGYLPEDYFPAYYEEADFCTQVRRAGYRVVYIPKAVAYHDEKHSGSGTMSVTFLRRYHKHRYLYALRNLTTAEERLKFITMERDWRGKYANDRNSRMLLLYSKLINWRWLIRRPWLFRV